MFAAREAAVGFPFGDSVGEGAGEGMGVWVGEGNGEGTGELVAGAKILAVVASGVIRVEATAVAVTGTAVGTAAGVVSDGPWGLQASMLNVYVASRVTVSLQTRAEIGPSSSLVGKQALIIYVIDKR